MSAYLTRSLDRIERLIGIDIRYALRSGFWLNMNSAVTLVGSFIVSIVFANFLPKEVFGTYQYLLSLLALLGAFTLTGMNAAVTRAVAQGNDGGLRASIRPQLVWNSFSALLALSISAYYLYQGDIQLGVGTVFIALALPLVATFNSYGAFLMGKQAFRTFFFYATAANVFYYAAIVATLFLAPAVLPLIAVNLFCTAVGPFVLYLVTVRCFKLSQVKTDPDSLSYGKHLSLMNLLGTASSQIDSFLVFHFLGPVQLATYSIATLIPDRLSGVFKNITNAMLPRFAEQSYARIRAGIARKSFLFIVLIGLAVSAYALIAPHFFSWFYPRYLEAVPYTQIFALTLITAAGNFAGAALLAHRHVRSLYALNSISPVVNLLLQLVGILVWGLWGLVIARVLGAALFFVMAFGLVIATSTGRVQGP